MTPKKFSLIFVAATAAFVAVNGLTWLFATEPLLTRNDGLITGDLARLGYISDIVQPRRNIDSLPRRHVEPGDYHGQPVDLLTIGDSFSNGGAGGPNRYYQDFIATRLNWRVLNLQRYPDARNDIETVLMLANAGELQRMGVRHVLLEATQRKAVQRLVTPVREDVRVPADQIRSYYGFGESRPAAHDLALPPVRFINTGNFKYWWNRLMYKVSDCALTSLTCRTALTARRFSTPIGDQLLFYRKDLTTIPQHGMDAIARMNRQLNMLATHLARQGIALLFLPAVTKYDLYRTDFVDDSYPRDPFFPRLREQSRKYVLIDSKRVLRQAIEHGALDMYYADDTHWTPKAAALIAEQVAESTRR